MEAKCSRERAWEATGSLVWRELRTLPSALSQQGATGDHDEDSFSCEWVQEPDQSKYRRLNTNMCLLKRLMFPAATQSLCPELSSTLPILAMFWILLLTVGSLPSTQNKSYPSRNDCLSSCSWLSPYWLYVEMKKNYYKSSYLES